MNSSTDLKQNPQDPSLDSLNDDIKLHLFSFMKRKDAMQVTAINKSQLKILETDRFWYQCIAEDYKLFKQPNSSPKQCYQALHAKQISKIRNLGICTLGIDNSKKLHIIDDLLSNQIYEANIIRKITAFSEKNEILDIRESPCQSTYILTQNGLYGFGNNCLRQLGFNTKGENVAEITCIYPSRSDDKIIQFACGMYFAAVQTEKNLWITGELTSRNKHKALTIPFPYTLEMPSSSFTLDIVKMKSSLFKLVIQRNDNSLIILDTQFFCDHLKQTRLLGFPHWEINEFKNKKIIDYFLCSKHIFVWCEDGVHICKFDKGKLTELNVFNNKKIINICTSDDYAVIHCDEGLFVMRIHEQFEVNADHENKLTEIVIDQSAHEYKIAEWPYVKIDGVWHKENTGTGIKWDGGKVKPDFQPVIFTPLSEAKLGRSEAEDDDACRCRIF